MGSGRSASSGPVSRSSARLGQALRPRRTGRRLWLLGAIAPLLWLGHRQVQAQLQSPEAILVLGGSIDREQYAAKLAQQHPDLPVWVSSGSNPEYAEWLFQEAQIDPERVTLDYRAVDTVTNFTTLVDDLKANQISCVYLVTSDYHMRRASVIGEIVLGSRGISFRPLAVPSGEPAPEALTRSLRDGARAVVWVLTGQTGSAWAESLGKS